MSRDLVDEIDRGAQLLGEAVTLFAARDREPVDLASDGTQVAHGLDDVARSGLALAANEARALADAPQRLAEVCGAAHEGNGERPLVDMMCLVGRREHLGLVDVVDPERLQDLRFGEVADAALRHHGNGDGLLDPFDHRGVAHARDSAVAPDVGGHALERHHGDRARVLGDLRLIGVDDIHDDAAAQHLREPALHACRPGGALFRHGVESIPGLTVTA